MTPSSGVIKIVFVSFVPLLRHCRWAPRYPSSSLKALAQSLRPLCWSLRRRQLRQVGRFCNDSLSGLTDYRVVGHLSVAALFALTGVATHPEVAPTAAAVRLSLCEEALGQVQPWQWIRCRISYRSRDLTGSKGDTSLFHSCTFALKLLS